jgi:hypothetical protein
LIQEITRIVHCSLSFIHIRTEVSFHWLISFLFQIRVANEIDGRLSGEAWITQFEAEYAQEQKVFRVENMQAA